jgi:hypothetical protein
VPLVFAAVAGAAVPIILIVAYRRQRIAASIVGINRVNAQLEQTRVYDERFTAATAQIGDGAEFSGGLVSFDGAKFTTQISFLLARFPGGEVDFSKIADWSYQPQFGGDGMRSSGSGFRADRLAPEHPKIPVGRILIGLVPDPACACRERARGPVHGARARRERTGGYQAAPGGFGAGPHGGPPRVACLPT